MPMNTVPPPRKMPMISAHCLLPNADELHFNFSSKVFSAPTLRLFVFVLLQFVVPPLVIHSMLFPPFVLLLAPIPLAFSIWPIVLAEPVFALDHLSLQNRASDEKHSSASTSSSLLSSVALTKCQSDYLSALIHRCMIRGAPTAMEGRICFADEVQLADVHKLVNYISEMCCLLRCQAKTLERLCCRHAQQQGRCRKANCLPIRDQKVLWEEAH